MAGQGLTPSRRPAGVSFPLSTSGEGDVERSETGGEATCYTGAMKRLRYKPYVDEKARWPEQGRVILAQYDVDSVVVYQAYSERIGHAAARQGRLDVAGFSLERMSRGLRLRFGGRDRGGEVA